MTSSRRLFRFATKTPADMARRVFKFCYADTVIRSRRPIFRSGPNGSRDTGSREFYRNRKGSSRRNLTRGDTMNRFALAALMIVIVFDSANAKWFPSNGHSECASDAQRFCSAVINDTDKRRACMRAHWSQLSQPCVASFKH